MVMRKVAVLGATGSIGLSTLDVIERHPDRFSVFALTAHQQVSKLAELCIKFNPVFAVVGSEDAAKLLTAQLPAQIGTKVLSGSKALDDIASHPDVDTVMAAIVGAAGLSSSLAAAKAGKRVLLANKETLVAGGALFMNAVKQSGAELLPIDSEHNAIFQCLPEGYRGSKSNQLDLNGYGINQLLLTASGGPFRDRDLTTLKDVTPAEACAHPNWSMGKKISVDSATMMNKGLEVIEAYWLFGVPIEQIKVVIHPQSIIHSMVSYRDGSVLAQMGNPDMRTPIAFAMDYPARIDAGVSALDFATISQLTFKEPDFNRYPCLALAFTALKAGGAMPAVLNAANEVAVDAFLNEKLGFMEIAAIVENVLEMAKFQAPSNLEDVLAVDRESRLLAKQLIEKQMH
ncbi:1-deoxy-D-xylulose-5-phosphate reductoisomerase [Leeia sp. TBRC 13508]|uniref:1-deoxy-D-xylulose 5-phosphate reductoisomerase n=1 Tax=Leeia speluncae TaxID=2884804 RepID=A0ABS8D6F1_9NEIS|nr:1-deoxy-D-xylulose-5-phosphate reductoisomerase [Leeia speluncae]MCB6183598.1 1-deoxy-D-xylulose-5-phosphate reductoisomerase [Leeia speluncae]